MWQGRSSWCCGGPHGAEAVLMWQGLVRHRDRGGNLMVSGQLATLR